MNDSEIDALADKLRQAAKAYYDSDELLMPDAEYDSGIEQLRMTVEEHPECGDAFDDLLLQVAAGQSAGGDVTHPSIMGSMTKVVGLDAVTEFVDSVGGPVVVEPKLDGLAIRAVYEQGKLSLVATRGDGHTGEDITQRVRNLKFLPDTLTTNASVEVRGEVFMGDANFPTANRVRTADGSAAFVNPRNAAAGILRKGDPSYQGLLTFAAYTVTTDAALDYHEALAVADENGITVASNLFTDLADEPTTDPDEVLERIALLDDRRDTLGFPIDGAVIKADRTSDRERMGEGSKAPKWAVAYKYEAESAETTVVGITTDVGRTGRLAIRIQVDPVFVGGTTVTYASGHNVSWMQERDIRVGDTVKIKRANDVIPYVEDVLLDQRPADTQQWEPPKKDPLGNDWDKSTLLWRSTSPELSVLGRIVYAVSRDCLDVEFLGTEIAAALVEQGLVTTIDQLFTLSADTLADLELDSGRVVGRKTADKIMSELEQAKSAPWNRVITALGIRGTGRTMGRRLAAAFTTMDDLTAASADDLAQVDGIGKIKADMIREGLDDLSTRGVIDGLKAAGVTLQSDSGDTTAKPLDGQTVVVTGSVPGLNRTQVQERVESLGGKSSGSVSTNTHLLVADPSATSSKVTKAQKLGVRIISPEEFLAL